MSDLNEPTLSLAGEQMPPPVDFLPDANSIEVGQHARNAYLDYAMSVVTSRALPKLTDGQKPVQRRILYAMHQLGLHDRVKPVKSARIIGDIIGKYHPHGDTACYDAAVRMAQDFVLRYPLIDGQGNFGSRDGDGAAAMRYTEARLTKYADLLLGELNQGTVDFKGNYDGHFQEPVELPTRLPMLLLNGASGIAVGMATEVPSHNLTEVALACEHLIRHPDALLADILRIMPGPDFPGGAQIISSQEEIAKVYGGDRGSIRVRARWTVEPLARGQYQIAITELPPGSSAAKVQLEIEALSNPQVKAGKKSLTQEQLNLKNLILSVISEVTDDSDGENPVRIVIQPRSSRQTPEEVMQVLLAHTSLEDNVPVNMVMLDRNGKPGSKSLMGVLQDWCSFRFDTVTRRINHRLGQVRARMHILQGRMIVFLNVDDVIKIIRESKDPHRFLRAKYGLSDAQADDILEIRLRQLAGLEKIKLETELAELAGEESVLQGMLDDRNKLTAQVLKELAEDRKKYGDARRTLIETAERVTTTTVAATSDDPVTLIISKAGWLRARVGHRLDLSGLTYKAGDECLAIIETRTSQQLLVMDTQGRAYNIAAAAIPTGRGDGAPITTLVEFQGGTLAQVALLDTTADYLLANSGSYGFLCKGADLAVKQKNGKAVMTLDAGDEVLTLAVITGQSDAAEAAFVTALGKLLVIPLSELKYLGKGRGVQLVSLSGKDKLAAVTATTNAITGIEVDTSAGPLTIEGTVLDKCRGHRARAGNPLPNKAKPVGLLRAIIQESVEEGV